MLLLLFSVALVISHWVDLTASWNCPPWITVAIHALQILPVSLCNTGFFSPSCSIVEGQGPVGSHLSHASYEFLCLSLKISSTSLSSDLTYLWTSDQCFQWPYGHCFPIFHSTLTWCAKTKAILFPLNQFFPPDFLISVSDTNKHLVTAVGPSEHMWQDFSAGHQDPWIYFHLCILHLFLPSLSCHHHGVQAINQMSSCNRVAVHLPGSGWVPFLSLPQEIPLHDFS